MKFKKTSTTYTPPKPGFHRHVIEVEDGPEWTEGRRRKVLHRITQVTVRVYDDGSTDYNVWERRITQSGTPYDESARKIWLPRADSYHESARLGHQVLEEIKRDDIQKEL